MTLLSMDWSSVFYWITVSDGVKSFFDTASNIFTTFSVILFIVMVICSIGKSYTISENNLGDDESDKKDPDLRSWEKARRPAAILFYISLGLALLTWVGYAAVPTKKDCLLIVTGSTIANFVTSDSSTKAIPADMARYLHLRLNKEITELNTDEQKELGIDTAQNRVQVLKKTSLDKIKDMAKDLTRDELLELLKTDSTGK